MTLGQWAAKSIKIGVASAQTIRKSCSHKKMRRWQHSDQPLGIAIARGCFVFFTGAPGPCGVCLRPLVETGMRAMQFVSNLIVAVGLGAILLAQSLAANPTVHEGVVVSAGAGQLTMKDKSGKQHSHPIGREVKITVHGKPGMLEDLQLGMPIRVTVDGSKVLGISTIDNIK